MKQLSYKSTITACYIGNFSQAIVINLTPILFIPLREQYGFSYSQFGFLVLVNFITQVFTDLAFSKAVDRRGFRPFVVSAHILCVVGLFFFALTPLLLPNSIYLGFVLATFIFSGAGGLFELLLSPIVDAIPSEAKEKAMALLHSFYAWGQVSVVILTTLAIYLSVPWQFIVMAWALVPFINIFLFAKAPLVRKVEPDLAMTIGELLNTPVFLFAFGAILFGGASEITMAQWASSFLEKGVRLPKIVGDILGLSSFAIMLGIGRLIYGIKGDKLNLEKILYFGAMLAAICYVVVALSPFAWLSILACSITGIGVSLLWPGTLVMASNKLPLAGASMFALLAAGGDIGASVGPWLTGVIADWASQFTTSLPLTGEQFALRLGILIATVFPLTAMFFIRNMAKQEYIR